MGTSDFLDVIPTAVGGSETTYFADYYSQSSSTGLALFRSYNSSNTNGGVSLTNANNAPSNTSTNIGSRLTFSVKNNAAPKRDVSLNSPQGNAPCLLAKNRKFKNGVW
jgi:hypothetical protein